MQAPRAARPAVLLVGLQAAVVILATMVVAAPAGGSTASARPSIPSTARGTSPSLAVPPAAAPVSSAVAPRIPDRPVRPAQTRPPMPVPTATPNVAVPRGSGTGGGTGGGAGAVAGVGRLPTCAYRDLPTKHDDYGDWHRTFLDTIYRLPARYAPRDLVDSSAAGLNGGYPIRAIVVDDLRAMVEAARAAGAPIKVVSGYRSHARQQTTFQGWVNAGGLEQALRTSARPGHSEHQLGTALDVTSLGGRDPWTYQDWATTKAGAWVAANSWRYGFVVSYPRGSFARTCYSYEPWHLRYVGPERAAAIRSSGLTPREFLWRIQ